MGFNGLERAGGGDS